MSEVIDRPKVERLLVGTRSLSIMLDLSVTYVRDSLTKKAGFPKHVWIGGAKRWWLDEVMDWIRRQQK